MGRGFASCLSYSWQNSIEENEGFFIWDMEKKKTKLDYLKVSGCLAFNRVLDPKRTKLGSRVIKSVFAGYAQNSKAYILLDLESKIIIETRDAEFIENKFWSNTVTKHTCTIENLQAQPQGLFLWGF